MGYTLEQLQKMGAKPVGASATTTTPKKAYTMQELQQMGAKPIGAPAPAPKVERPEDTDGFLKTVVKDPIKTLLVKPAIRTADAIGAAGVYAFGGDEAKKKVDEYISQDKVVDVPVLGKYTIEGVKSDPLKAAKQITGETAKSASYIWGGGSAANVGKQVLAKRVGSAVAGGIGAGAATGALYGGGDAAEKDGSAMDIAAGTAGGAAIGAAAGAALPLAGAALGKMGSKATQVARSVPEKVTTMVDRANAPQHIKAARSTGIDDTIVDFVTTAMPEDKQAFARMVQIAERAGKDIRYRERPLQEAGKSILKRAEHLVKVKDVGTASTKRVIDSLDNTPFDTSNILYTFMDDMRELGIQIVKRGNSYQMVSQGKVPQGDMDMFRLMLQQIAPDSNGTVMRSHRGLHTARQRIFNELNLSKARQNPFSDTATQYGEHFRKLLADPIDEASKGKYRAAQRKTADAMDALRDFVQLLGYKGDLEKLTTKDLRTGEVFMRVLGNAADRPMSVLQTIDDTAKKYGYKATDSALDQLKLADILEDVYGTTQTRSLRGQVGRAGLDAINEATGAANDIANQNMLGLGVRTVKAMLGKSKEAQIKAFKELIETEAKNAPKPTIFGKRVATTKLSTAPLAKEAGARYTENMIPEPKVGGDPNVMLNRPVPKQTPAEKAYEKSTQRLYREVEREDAMVEKTAETLMKMESKIWDKLKIKSGSQLAENPALKAAYDAELEKLGTGIKSLPKNLQQRVLDTLEDQNYHSMVEFLSDNLKKKSSSAVAPKVPPAARSQPKPASESLPKNSTKKSVLGRLKDKLPPMDQRGFVANPFVKGSAEAFKGFSDVTTRVLRELEGKTTVSRQYLLDATNRPDLKQAERELVRKVANEFPTTVPVREFANRVKTELLPLNIKGSEDVAASRAAARKKLEEKGYILEQDMGDVGYFVDKNGEYVEYDDMPRDIQALAEEVMGNAETYSDIVNPTRYERVSLPDDVRGPVANYAEHIYESPIKTSAGSVHFSGATDSYFAHTRIEDMSGSTNPKASKMLSGPNQGTRRVIEIQSDLFQKGRLEREVENAKAGTGVYYRQPEIIRKYTGIRGNATPDEHVVAARKLQREDEKAFNQMWDEMIEAEITPLNKLEPYRNTWWERIIKEEVKRAAKDGKIKLQFPTGDTAMEIEGLGRGYVASNWRRGNVAEDFGNDFVAAPQLTPDTLKVGETVTNGAMARTYEITEVLGDGRFRAYPTKALEDLGLYADDIWAPAIKVGEITYNGKKYYYNEYTVIEGASGNKGKPNKESIDEFLRSASETFDIGSSPNKENPIYKFYEKDVQRFLTRKYGGKVVTDPQGVQWVEIDVPKDADKFGVEAFGALAIPSVFGKKKEEK